MTVKYIAHDFLYTLNSYGCLSMPIKFHSLSYVHNVFPEYIFLSMTNV